MSWTAGPNGKIKSASSDKAAQHPMYYVTVTTEDGGKMGSVEEST